MTQARRSVSCKLPERSMDAAWSKARMRIAAAAVAVAANIAVWALLHVIWSARVDEVRAELRSLGFFDDGVAGTPSQGPGAARMYRDALARVEPLRRTFSAGGSEPRLTVTLLEPGAPMREDAMRSAESILAEYADAIRLVVQATTHDTCDWGDLEDTPELVAGVEALRRLLETSAIEKGSAGRCAEAALAVQALFHLTRALSTRPSCLRALLAESTLRSASRALADLLIRMPAYEASLLQPISRYLDDAMVARALAEGLRRDYRLLLEPLGQGTGWWPASKRMFAAAARACAEAARALDVPYSDGMRIAARVEMARAELGSGTAWAQVLPMAPALVEARAASTALMRLAQAALRIKAAGTLPRDDDAAGAALGEDPYTGGRLRYRLLGGGAAAIYSVGWNLTDDGGTGPLWERRPADLVFPLR